MQLAMAQQRAIYEVARAKGDESRAIRAANELRKLEIQLAELSARAKRAEAEAALASVAAKRAELEANGQLVGAKRLEMDAAQKSAEVKVKEAEIAEVTAKKMKDLVDVHNELGQGAGGTVGGIDAVTNALGRQAGAADAAGNSIRRMQTSFGGGFGSSSKEAEENLKRLRSIHDRQRLGGSDPEKSDIQNLYDRYSMNGDQSLKDIDASRKNVSGNASINDTDIQADIVKRYGEEMLDDPLTREAFNLRLQLNAYRQGYGTARSKQSLQEQANIMAALERVEREIEQRRLAKERERKEAEKSESGSASSSGSSNDGASDSGSRSSGSGISTGTGTGTGTGNDSRSSSGGATTYQSTIVLPNGRRETVSYPDAQSQSTNERLLRALADGKGVYQ